MTIFDVRKTRAKQMSDIVSTSFHEDEVTTRHEYVPPVGPYKTIRLKIQADSNITLRQWTPQISHLESSYMSHTGHLITAVMANLNDQINP